MRARRQPGASDPARAILCEAGGGSAVPLERARDKLERARGSPPPSPAPSLPPSPTHPGSLLTPGRDSQEEEVTDTAILMCAVRSGRPVISQAAAPAAAGSSPATPPTRERRGRGRRGGGGVPAVGKVRHVLPAAMAGQSAGHREDTGTRGAQMGTD